MAESSVWVAGLRTLRARFEAAACKYHGVRCSLTRESYIPGKYPIAAAAARSPEGLRPIIGAQVDGIAVVHSGQVSSDETFFTWWLRQPSLSRARSNAKFIPSAGEEFLHEQATAIECDGVFSELTDNAGRFLEDVPSDRRTPLNGLIKGPELIYGTTLWLITMIEMARRGSLGSPVQTTVTLLKGVEVDVLAATGGGNLPDSVIVNLVCSPFAASIALIDLLLEPGAVPPEPDGPCGINQWRHNGKKTASKMKPQTWKLAKRLHESLDEKVSFDVLIGADKVFLDDQTSYEAIQRQGSLANTWFAKQAIPLTVGSSTVDRQIWMEKASSDA